MTCICIKVTKFGIFALDDSYEYSIEKHVETGILLYNVKLPLFMGVSFTLPGSIKSIPFTEENFNIYFIDLQSKRDKIFTELGI